MLLALAEQAVQTGAVDTDQPWIRRDGEAVFGLKDAKRPSQTAGKEWAHCQPSVPGCPFGGDCKCCKYDWLDDI